MTLHFRFITIILVLTFGTNNFVQAQEIPNTAKLPDTSSWESVRRQIKMETRFIKRWPDAEHYYKRGKYKAVMHEWKSALSDLDKSIEFNPNVMISYYIRGGVKERLDDLEGSRDDFSKVIELRPDFKMAWLDRAQIYTKLKNFDAAKEDLDMALKLYPNWSLAFFRFGNLYSDKKDYDKAIIYYEKCIEINKGSYMAYNNLGDIYYKKRNYDKAIFYTSEAIMLFPDYVKALKTRVGAKMAKGDTDFCEDIKKLVKLGDIESIAIIDKYCPN
ncbi:tetratricopeptide repeat protein [Aquimarina sp. AU58]|uniref:tetratricopeptide repeat protein n=1 Tax=Aquimarina sp. AU58 TaxID=1874112 RepID=UPI000D6E2C88|nr:tetratricopeptide repeat protein [Aquimarina sp. AU58]